MLIWENAIYFFVSSYGGYATNIIIKLEQIFKKQVNVELNKTTSEETIKKIYKLEYVW